MNAISYHFNVSKKIIRLSAFECYEEDSQILCGLTWRWVCLCAYAEILCGELDCWPPTGFPQTPLSITQSGLCLFCAILMEKPSAPPAPRQPLYAMYFNKPLNIGMRHIVWHCIVGLHDLRICLNWLKVAPKCPTISAAFIRLNIGLTTLHKNTHRGVSWS